MKPWDAVLLQGQKPLTSSRAWLIVTYQPPHAVQLSMHVLFLCILTDLHRRLRPCDSVLLLSLFWNTSTHIIGGTLTAKIGLPTGSYSGCTCMYLTLGGDTCLMNKQTNKRTNEQTNE